MLQAHAGSAKAAIGKTSIFGFSVMCFSTDFMLCKVENVCFSTLSMIKFAIFHTVDRSPFITHAGRA